MALFTERAVKRHPVAVITVECLLADVAKGGHFGDFEWFNSVEAAEAWMTQWTSHATSDSAEYSIIDGTDPAMAYLTILIPDTETMVLGKNHVVPLNNSTEVWRDEITDDITALYEKAEAAPKKAPVVKARRGLKLAGKPASRESEVEDTKPRVRRVIHKHGIEGPQ